MSNAFEPATTDFREVPDGTLAEPGLAFADDPDSGLYRLGPDQIAIGVGNVLAIELAKSAGIAKAKLPPIASDSANNVLLGSAGSPSIVPSQSISNTSLGYQSLASLTYGQENTCFGKQAGVNITGTDGASTTSGALNTCIGSNAGGNVTTGGANTLLGQKAGNQITTGSGNVCVGKSTGANYNGTNGILIGATAGQFASTTGQSNILIGFNSGRYLQGTSEGNVFVGVSAGNGLSGSPNTASYNVAIGTDALTKNASGTQQVCIGFCAGQNITTATGNTCIGFRAGSGNISFGPNVIIGANAGSTYDGLRCIILGSQAGNSLPSGAQNYFVAGAPGNNRITEVYFGSGYAASTAYDYSINGSGGSGTDTAGGGVTIGGGKGTGSGAGGSVKIATSASGATGSALNSLTVHMEVDSDGNIILPTIPTSDPGVPGALWSDAGTLKVSA